MRRAPAPRPPTHAPCPSLAPGAPQHQTAEAQRSLRAVDHGARVDQKLQNMRYVWYVSKWEDGLVDTV